MSRTFLTDACTPREAPRHRCSRPSSRFPSRRSLVPTTTTQYNRNKKGLAMIHTHKWMDTSNKNNKDLSPPVLHVFSQYCPGKLHHHQHVRTCHVCSACSPRCICRTASTVAPPSGRWRPVKMALTCEGASRVVVIFFNIFTRRLYTVNTVQSVKTCVAITCDTGQKKNKETPKKRTKTMEQQYHAPVPVVVFWPVHFLFGQDHNLVVQRV